MSRARAALLALALSGCKRGCAGDATPPEPVTRHEAPQPPPPPLTLSPRCVRELDAILEVFWYTQQLHRIAAGRDPDPHRGNWRALLDAIWTNGLDTFRRKRS